MPFMSRKTGIGNGERRLAAELGYRMSPKNSNYDLAAPNGDTVEVKHMGRDNRIRIGITSAAWPLLEAMNDVRRFVADIEPGCGHLVESEVSAALRSAGQDIPMGRLRVDEPAVTVSALRRLERLNPRLVRRARELRTSLERILARAQRDLGAFFKTKWLAIVDEGGYCLIPRDEIGRFFEIHSMSQYRFMFGAKKAG